jgi:hypothetical protein
VIKHRETHPTPVDGCFGCRIATVAISAAAMPTRHAAVNERSASWEKLMKDDEAYKRLRADGFAPKSTKDCAVLEQVDDRRFIEGRPLGWEQRGEILESLDDAPQVKVET